MASRAAPDFNEEARKLQARLPRWAGAALRWGVESSPLVRWPIAIILVFGGFLGFLPILGFWMAPLGLILIAEDLPFLRPPLARLFAWILRRWPERSGAR
jgi:hypothetical protein